MKVIAYARHDGISICVPTGEVSLEYVLENDIPKIVTPFIIEWDDIPHQDSDFRNAWILQNGVVSVDLAQAKELTKDRLRTEREPLFGALDTAFMKALEQGADTSAIVAEKTRLRNLPLLADSCNTLEELRQLKAA